MTVVSLDIAPFPNNMQEKVVISSNSSLLKMPASKSKMSILNEPRIFSFDCQCVTVIYMLVANLQALYRLDSPGATL